MNIIQYRALRKIASHSEVASGLEKEAFSLRSKADSIGRIYSHGAGSAAAAGKGSVGQALSGAAHVGKVGLRSGRRAWNNMSTGGKALTAGLGALAAGGLAAGLLSRRNNEQEEDQRA